MTQNEAQNLKLPALVRYWKSGWREGSMFSLIQQRNYHWVGIINENGKSVKKEIGLLTVCDR